MGIFLSGFIGRIHPMVALAKCIAIFVSYLLGSYVSEHIHDDSVMPGAILACTSTVVVLQQQDLRDSLRRGWLRVLGTFIGTVIAYFYLLMFPFTLAGMIIAVFILELICMVLKVPDNGKMATITLIIILIVSRESPALPPWINGLLRFSEATIGAATGIGMLWLIYGLQKMIHPAQKTPPPQKTKFPDSFYLSRLI